MFPKSTVTTAILMARVYKRESVLPTKRYSPLGGRKKLPDDSTCATRYSAKAIG